MKQFYADKRKVRRVLVMIDFVDRPEGEVYDFTALAAEMFERSPYGATIGVDVKAEYGYTGGVRKLDHFHVTFDGNAGEHCFGATHVEDVVNYAMQDGERVVALRKKEARLRKKADDLRHDIMHAKLLQVAEIRAQHPIATFNLSDHPQLKALPETAP